VSVDLRDHIADVIGDPSRFRRDLPTLVSEFDRQSPGLLEITFAHHCLHLKLARCLGSAIRGNSEWQLRFSSESFSQTGPVQRAINGVLAGRSGLLG
jgi:hypothetical protein